MIGKQRQRIVIGSALALVSALSARPARGEIVERIAGVVNGQPITYSDVLERGQLELQRLAQQPASLDREKQRQDILKRALDILVDEKLIEAEAGSLGVEVSDDDQNKSVEALARQNGLTVDQFKEELAKQKIDFATVKDSLRRQALRFKLLNAKVKPRKITEEEIKGAYAARTANPEHEVRARHIYMRVPQNAPPEVVAAARKRAETALARLHAGEEFALVARELSDGPTAKTGGDLGYFRRGMLLPELEAAAMRLEPGQVSPILKLATGFHLVKVEDKRPLPQKSLSELQEDIRAQLGQDSVIQEQTRFLNQLRKSAQVDLRI
jgi:peptidyl-prolyl cis-trans isomerase SurA